MINTFFVLLGRANFRFMKLVRRKQGLKWNIKSKLRLQLAKKWKLHQRMLEKFPQNKMGTQMRTQIKWTKCGNLSDISF